MSFPLFYFGTIVSLLALDQLRVLHPSGKSAWETFPPRDSWSKVELPTSSIRLVLFSLFVLTPLLHAWRRVVKNFFSGLALRAAGLREGTLKHEKFVEQAWLAVHYTMVSLLGYAVLRDKPWWPPTPTKEQASHYGLASLEDRTKDQDEIGLQLYYATQLAFYMLELLSLLLMKERRTRSDAFVYFFHHIYTVVLLAGSWLTIEQRIGSLVLFLHDIGDIFLPIGKMFTYSEDHTKKTRSHLTYQLVQAAGIFFFVLFIISFGIPRLYYFGGVVYRTMYDVHWTVCCGVLANGTCGACPAPFFQASLACILFLLWPMHVFWFYLIMRMAIKVVSGVYQDVRSDDEGEDESSKKGK